jgi:hypothetical protein
MVLCVIELCLFKIQFVPTEYTFKNSHYSILCGSALLTGINKKFQIFSAICFFMGRSILPLTHAGGGGAVFSVI